MLFYPIQRKLFEGTDREQWKTIGHIAGPLSEACDVLREVVTNRKQKMLHFRLAHPEEGIGMAEDWLCPKCGHDHIIRWQDDTFSCTACKTFRGNFYVDTR